MSTQDTTIVTGCDHHYWWGSLLLAASLRRHGVTLPVHILGAGFDPQQVRCLTQFEDVRVLESSEQRGMQMLKPDAILTADSQWICWMDADCIVTGDVTAALTFPAGSWSIRQRNVVENAWRYRNQYGDGESSGIPAAVLSKWAEDVGEKQTPALDTTMVTNCFTLDRSHLPFVRKWREQMRRVLPADATVKDETNLAYSLSDECVLNSLLCYSTEAPDLFPYTLDSNPEAAILHFYGRPKPWEQWSRKHLAFRGHIFDVVDWIVAEGYEMPELPKSLQTRSNLASSSQAWLGDLSNKLWGQSN